MTRYTMDMIQTEEGKEEKRTALKEVPVFIQLMSGEVIHIHHSPWKSLYALKQKIREHCDEWKPHLQELFYLDSEGEYVRCPLIHPPLKEGDRLFLFIKDPILHEFLSFVYTYDGFELYRFVYLDREGDPAFFCFSVRNGNEFSLNHVFCKSHGRQEDAVWFTSIEETVDNYKKEGMQLEEDVRENMVRLWRERQS